MTRFRCLSYLALVTGVSALGCGSGGNAAIPAKVSGTVSYKGQPIKSGSMRFHAEDGSSFQGMIATDGSYTADGLPVGELVVTVETESVKPDRPAPKGKDAAMRSKMMDTRMQAAPEGTVTAQSLYIKIPDKYNNPKTSPLKVTLTNGRQVHNFDLTD